MKDTRVFHELIAAQYLIFSPGEIRSKWITPDFPNSYYIRGDAAGSKLDTMCWRSAVERNARRQRRKRRNIHGDNVAWNVTFSYLGALAGERRA